jgi:hypothetical protein
VQLLGLAIPGYALLALADPKSCSRISRIVRVARRPRQEVPQVLPAKVFLSSHLLSSHLRCWFSHAVLPDANLVRSLSEKRQKVSVDTPSYSDAHLESFTGHRNKIFSPVFTSSEKFTMDLRLAFIQMARHLLPFWRALFVSRELGFAASAPGGVQGDRNECK